MEERRLRGISLLSVTAQREHVEGMEPGSAQWCLGPGAEAVAAAGFAWAVFPDLPVQPERPKVVISHPSADPSS